MCVCVCVCRNATALTDWWARGCRWPVRLVMSFYKVTASHTHTHTHTVISLTTVSRLRWPDLTTGHAPTMPCSPTPNPLTPDPPSSTLSLWLAEWQTFGAMWCADSAVRAPGRPEATCFNEPVFPGGRRSLSWGVRQGQRWHKAPHDWTQQSVY